MRGVRRDVHEPRRWPSCGAEQRRPHIGIEEARQRAESVAANLPLGESVRRLAHHERSTRGWIVRAVGVAELANDLPPAPEQSVVMIDIAPFDEDEMIRRALPDIDRDVRILGTSSPSAPATRADRPARGARSRAASAPFRRVEAGHIHLADDLTAFVREEV